MALISVIIQSRNSCLGTWTTFQADPGVSFSELCTMIACGWVSVIIPTHELSTARLEHVFVCEKKAGLYWIVVYSREKFI